MLLEWNGHEYPITSGGLSIGRSHGNDIVLDDDEVSRRHARVWESGGQVYVRDESSRNGTLLNGTRLSGTTAVQAGDRIQLGGTFLEVREGHARGNASMELTRYASHYVSVRPASRESILVDSEYISGAFNPDGYVEQSLLTDERLLVKAKLHWGIFVAPIVGIFVGLILIAASAILGQMANSSSASIGLLVCVALPITMGGLLGLINAFMMRVTTEFAVTNKRLIAKVGSLNRHSLELFLHQVEAITVDQTVMGRILNYGTIVVHGSGGTKQGFPSIENPLGLRRSISKEIGKQIA